MEKINTSSGKISVIDKEDYERVSKFKWSWGGRYVTRKDYSVKPNKTIFLHCFILGKKNGFDIDHINGDRLDNRKKNLRHCTHLENSRNRVLSKNNKSGIIGVHWNKKSKKWQAQIGLNFETKNLGYYEKKEDAVIARKKAELKYFN